MSKQIDTFSSNSLKILEKSTEEFEKIYVHNLSLFKKDDRAILGQKFHSLICAYLKGFGVDRIIKELNREDLIVWRKLEELLRDKKNNFIKTEYPFLIKEELNSKNYYLTGRFDAIYQENDKFIIYDWKTLNLPKNPVEDLQSVVYLYCASKIFNTKNISMKYLSIEKLNFVEVQFQNENEYKKRIDKIVSKLN